MTDDELSTLLRKQAQEIADEGHAGWGNTMQMAADALARLRAEKAKLIAALRTTYHALDAARSQLVRTVPDDRVEGQARTLDQITDAQNAVVNVLARAQAEPHDKGE